MGKTFPSDQKIVKRIYEIQNSGKSLFEENLTPSSPHLPVEFFNFFETLQNAKFDSSSLDLPDLLIKDYKDWVVGPNHAIYGMSSILLSLDEWLSREQEADFLQQFQDFSSERNLSIFFCLLASKVGNEFRRELIIYQPLSPSNPINFPLLVL
eukprot:TRINITY_DN7580_c0_g1_i7.p1 TRINITY_DN7580_c0_g1~~TRINITY_DN7580_c0_g1_i7.p1  ORF type:complete len:153 (-),score=36.23 TRINITY_DN7580_c0_g1_i7:167-625(-)